MNRSLVALVVGGGILLNASLAHAAPADQNSVQQMARNAAQFRIPESAFLPGKLNASADRVESNAMANRDDFKANHRQSYDQLGRLSGYFERGTWGSITLSYMASVFATPFQADNAFREGLGITDVGNSHAPEGCGYIYNHDCARLSWTAKSSAGVYWVDEYNNCLVEVKAQAPSGIFSASKDSISPTSSAMVAAGDQIMTSICGNRPVSTPPDMDYSVVDARVERRGAAADLRLLHPGLRSVHVGTPVILSIYFSVRKAPANCRAVATFTVRRKGFLFTRRSHALAVSTDPGVYRLKVNFVPRVAGKYAIRGSVDMDGWTQKYNTGLTVAARGR